MAAPAKQAVLTAQKDLLRTITGCVIAIVVIHILPKSRVPHDSMRLIYTVAYFAAWGLLCVQMIWPRERYMELLYAWRFEDAPAPMERAWQRYLYSLNQMMRVLFGLTLLFLASTGLSLLSRWIPSFQALSIFYKPGWWLSMVGIVLLPFAGGFLFHELAQRYRSLNEEVSLSQNFKPRRTAELRGPESEEQAHDFRLGDKFTFRAGGVDWQWDDFYKNGIVFGQSGSGKTICVLNALVDGLLGSAAKAGVMPSGLILDPKGDFAGKIQSLCHTYRWKNNLMIIDPGDLAASMRWNPLDTPDDELELAGRFAAVLEATGMKSSDTSFWVDSAKKFFRHSVALIRLTNPPGQPPSFAQIQELATSFAAIVARTDRLDARDPRCNLCLNYFANEWIDLACETRSSIQAYVTNMLDPFLMEPYATMFSGRSTCRVSDMVDSGKILYVNMPVADKEVMARMVGTFVKLEYFREVLKRPDKKRPSFFLCDEFQVFFTTNQDKGDCDFFERSRQSNHANIIATQNLPALLRQSPKREPVTNLLGNCAVKIFLRNTDQETNEYGSQLFGQQLLGMAGAQGAPTKGRLSSFGQSMGSHDGWEMKLRPERFTTLAIPARTQAAGYCESIVHLGARPEVEKSPRTRKWPVHPIQTGSSVNERPGPC